MTHHDLLTLTGRDGTPLHLLAATISPEEVTAEGTLADVHLRAGRVFTTPDGNRYRLTRGVPPGITWEEPAHLTTKENE